MNVTTRLNGNNQTLVQMYSAVSAIVLSVSLSMNLVSDSDLAVIVSNNRDMSSRINSQPLPDYILHKLCVNEKHHNLSSKTLLCPNSTPSKSQSIYILGSRPGMIDSVSIKKSTAFYL